MYYPSPKYYKFRTLSKMAERGLNRKLKKKKKNKLTKTIAKKDHWRSENRIVIFNQTGSLDFHNI